MDMNLGYSSLNMINAVKYSTGSHSMNYCILKIDFTVYIGNT